MGVVFFFEVVKLNSLLVCVDFFYCGFEINGNKFNWEFVIIFFWSGYVVYMYIGFIYVSDFRVDYEMFFFDFNNVCIEFE